MFIDRGEIVEIVVRVAGVKRVTADRVVEHIEKEMARQEANRPRFIGRPPKLSLKMRAELMRQVATMPYAAVAERFGISVSTVGRIVRGQ